MIKVLWLLRPSQIVLVVKNLPANAGDVRDTDWELNRHSLFLKHLFLACYSKRGNPFILQDFKGKTGI